MNIIFLRSNPVDPDSRVEKEVNSLLKSGHQVEIIAWDRSDNYKIKESFLKFESGDVKIYRFGIPAIFGGGMRKNIIPLLQFQIKLFLWLHNNCHRFDAIHACDFDTAFISSKVAFKLKKKFVYDIFDYYVDAFHVPQKFKRLIENIDRDIINKSNAVIICTEQRIEQISGTDPQILYVIHNTPPLFDTNYCNRFLQNNKIKIGYVGILDEGRLIRETAEIVSKNAMYEFHVGGFGKLEEYLRTMASKYENIYFYGKIPYNKTIELENCCDILTAIYNPRNRNNYYAAPNKFYEAIMLGKPLIVVRGTGIDNTVTEYGIGEVIEYSKNSLEKGLESLVLRQSEWSNISKIMKHLYNTHYSWEEMEKRLIELYTKL